MTTIDFIFLGVLALLVLIGLWKGFLGMLLGGFATFLISLAGAVITGMFLGDLLYGTGMASSLQELLIGKFDGINPIFTQIITKGDGGVLLMNGLPIAEAIQSANLPSFFTGLFEGILKTLMGGGLIAENATLTQCLVPFVTRLIVQIAVGFLSFFLILILVAIVRHYFAQLLECKTLRYVDKAVGVCIMAVISCGLAIAFGYVVNIANISSMKVLVDQSVILAPLLSLLPIA